MTGLRGEEAAASYLQSLGLVIVERNWRCRSGEIDLIALEEAVLVFVEVRSRSSTNRFGTAIEAITPRKCRQVRDIASIYMRMKGESNRSVRFDAVAVTFSADGEVAEIKHIPGAF
ncbi:YraN family protein [Cohnella faecalis]|uniref:UPF0102 protein D3H35_11295 n=1 Tax=Cohnella faecalis TaxID=2315694 RepID=A0A398CUH5_9BACL|nr:YraN family protein [Cohnella faecalis]